MKSFGTVRYDTKKREWLIDAEPHVVIRLKRVFGRVSKRSHGTIRITDTIETSRDLQWFLERFPMKVENPDQLERRAGEHRAREAAVEALLSGHAPPPTLDLAVPLREYQRTAAGVLLANSGLLLADDVGLGKTATAIGTFADPRTLPALVVTLTHLPKQWEAEIKRFAPKLRTHIVKKGTPYDLRVGAKGRRDEQLELVSPEIPDVIIINYHKLSGWAETLAGVVRSVVFDEVQELRRRQSEKYSAAQHLAERAHFRLGLSATPVYNLGSEIYSVLSVLHPHALGTWEEFCQEWCTNVDHDRDRASIADPKAFGTYARESGMMLRRTRTDVGRELPALTKVPHHIDADEHALAKVESSAAELARVILRQGQMFKGEKMQASEEFSNMLRQATGIAKAPFVADFVRLLVESGEKVVLYGWHRAVYEVWLDRLKDLGPVLYTGSESVTQKDAAKRTFVEGQGKVMIISLRAGAGLDGLQHVCRTVVFGELDWSPGVHEQCVGRVYRDGQKDPVVAYYLIAEHGADPVIADVLQVKKAQADGIRDPDAELLEALDIGTGNVKRLAEQFLEQRGIAAPAEEVA